MRARFTSALLLLLATSAHCWKKKATHEDAAPAITEEDMPSGLVGTLGELVFEGLNSPKYRFYIYMVMGAKLERQQTIAFISTLCNLLYGVCILLGFLGIGGISRSSMLIFSMLTVLIGPAIILILLAGTVAVLAAFAFYPTVSVSVVWLCAFSTSRAGQMLGRRLGLDKDKDGDVDMLDVLAWAAERSWGKALRLDRIHAFLNPLAVDLPGQVRKIMAKLDQIDDKVDRSVKKSAALSE